MPPLSFDKAMLLDPKNLDPDEIDDLFSLLKEIDPSEDTDVVKLKQLVKLTKEVMIFKHQDYEDAMMEAEKEAELSEKKENEMKSKISKLNRELEEVKKFGPQSEERLGTSNTHDVRYLRDQIRDYDDQIQQLQAENRELQRDLSNEKRAAEKYSEKISELDEELARLRKDNDQYRQDISDYMLRLQAQRENLVAINGDDQDIREKMSKKNRELADAMEEIQNLTDNNDLLQKRCEELGSNLSDANDQMFKATEDYQKIKAVLQQSDDIIDKLRHENDILKVRVDDLTEEVQSKTESDDAIMVAVNNKIDEWKVLVADKDQQLDELRGQVFRLREKYIAANMDTDRTSVAALLKANKDKDKQIEELTDKVSQYVTEMETNAGIIEELRRELHKDNKNVGDRYADKVRELQSKMKENSDAVKMMEKEAHKTLEDAQLKDKEVSELLERMKKYEAGEYGLKEAVAEIKEYKIQVKIRDRQIEELTKHINQAEMRINDILDENEEFRYRLGMDPKEPIDLDKVRENKAIKKEEEKALNFILQSEIERLEEERTDLKKKIRKLAQKTGQRAVALGLTTEDMLAVQDFQEELKHKKQVKIENSAPEIRRTVEIEERMVKDQKLQSKIQKNIEDIDELCVENIELKAQAKKHREENELLKDSLKELAMILKAKKSDGELQNSTLQLTSLDKILKIFESNTAMGVYDASNYMKEQFNIMKGRNEELKSELKEIRGEANKASLERDKALEKIKEMEKMQQYLQENTLNTSVFKISTLPEGMTATSTEIIQSLNEHLIFSLQAMLLKDEQMNKIYSALEKYKRKFAVIRHEHGLVYQEYLKSKKDNNIEVQKLKDKITSLECLREDDKVVIEQYNTLTNTLSQDDDPLKQSLAELSRKVVAMKVNEKALVRRHSIMEEIEAQLRKSIQNLNDEMGQMKTTVIQRICYLQRHKEMVSFKISALQKTLDNSVPIEDLEKVNQQYHVLTEKYRDLLEKRNDLVNKADVLIGLQNEVKHMTEINDDMKKTMAIEKEKLHALEATVEDLHKRGLTKGENLNVSDGDIFSISKKITTLEMKELNERQRAEHAVKIYEQQTNIIKDLEARNKLLEEKFSEITKMNLEMQKIERTLRDDLANSVLKSTSDEDKKKICEHEETILYLRQEASKLKEISEVAEEQVKILEAQNMTREQESKSLRQQLLDFQMQSDEKTIIGKLHRHIVQLQVSEGTAVRKYEECLKNITKTEAQLLRLEQKIDVKEKTIYHNKTEFQNKCRYLKRSLQDLRIQFAGAIPLTKQERFSKLMINLQNDKGKLEKEVQDVRENKEKLEEQVQVLSLKQESLQELIDTFKDGHGASKVKEWHGRMDALRISELKLKRKNAALREQIKYLEEVIRCHEVTLSDLEAENVKLTKEYDERQLIWEQREVELERTITQLEHNASEISGAASEFEGAIKSLPGAKLPVANQLQQAITTIKSNVKVILETQAETKILKQRVAELEKLRLDAEHTVVQRDKLITELRLKMPASADPDGVTAQKVKNSVNPTDTLNANKADFGENHSLRIAQTTINNLKQRIQQKDETVFKYQQLLSQARNDLQDMNRYHEEELKSMQQKIHLKTDDAFNKFKETAEALMNKQITSRSSINKQIANQLELENMLSESEKAIKSLSEKLKQREDELRQMHSKMVAIEKLNNKESFVETPKIDTMQDEKKESNYIVDELQKEIAILNEEINTLKDTTGKRATQSMKNLVERLKNQLTQKEKQHQALSKALKELQAEMVTQAQDALKVNLDNLGDEKNIQKLIDQQTDQYRDEIEDLKTEREKLRKEMKRRKEEISKHLSELEDLQEELALKEKTVSKLRSEKHSLEEMVAEYEKKLERISAKNQKKPLDNDRQGELEETRRRLHMVEEKLKKRELMAEKPYEKENQKEDTTARWEENKKWRKTVEKMKNKLVERDGEISELKRTIEMLKLENTRVKPASNLQLQSHRPIESSQSNRVIQKEKISELESFEKGKKYIQSEMVSSPRSVGSSMSSIKRIGESGKSIRELEKTIALMKRVIEKCQTENDMLKQTMSGFRSEKISLLEQENDALKKEINDIKYQTAQNFHEHETTQKKGTMKLMNDYEKLRKELLKEKEINEKLMLNLHTKEIEHEHQCKQLESIKSKQEIEEAKKLSSNTDYSGWKSAVVTRMYEDQIKNLQSDIEKKNKHLFDQKKLLKEAAEKEVDLMDKIKQLHHHVSILERLPNLNDTELMKEYHQARTKISKLEYDNELLLRDLKLHRENDQVNEDILSKARKYDQILEENIEIKMNLKTALLERDQYKQSSSKLRKEFGPESFEEMEDLKYNYKQAVQKNIMYEEKLVNISKQFGIDINIPGLE